MSCENCKQSINGEPSTIIYFDHTKKVCDKCSFKKPGLGKCFICANVPKDQGNYIMNKERKIYKFFCGSENCKFVAQSMSKKDSCRFCGIQENLKVCGGCKKVFYCSTECQKKDRNEHKKLCF